MKFTLVYQILTPVFENGVRWDTIPSNMHVHCILILSRAVIYPNIMFNY